VSAFLQTSDRISESKLSIVLLQLCIGVHVYVCWVCHYPLFKSVVLSWDLWPFCTSDWNALVLCF